MVDKLGILASAICAVQCALGAVLAGASGVLGPVLEDERIESVLAGLAVLVVVVALGAGLRRHRERAPLIVALLGILVIGASRLVELPIEHLEVVLSIGGAGLLITSHALNLRALRRAEACCPPTA
jgi:hypothetical protein